MYQRVEWHNSLDCTDLNQCGVHRDAEFCRLCYKVFKWQYIIAFFRAYLDTILKALISTNVISTIGGFH